MTFCLAEFYFYSYKLAPYSKLNDAVPAIEQLQVHLPVCRTGESCLRIETELLKTEAREHNARHNGVGLL